MHLDTATIQRIVGDVLMELSALAAAPRAVPSVSEQSSTVGFSETVITASLLEDRLNGSETISIAGRALLTPAAQDLIRERSVSVVRVTEAAEQENFRSATKLIVVTPHPATDELLRSSVATRELAGSTDEAAKLAISAVCRGEAERVLILTDKPHQAACQANRNDRVRAAVAADAGDVRGIGPEFSVNVWCVNPSSRSTFELTRLGKAIKTTHDPLPTTH